jgi:hypothetical protein
MSLQELDREEGYTKDTRPGKEYLESKPYEEASSLLCSELKKFGFDETKQSKFPYGSSAPPVLGAFKYTIDYFNDQYKVKRWKAPTGAAPAGGFKSKFPSRVFSPTNMICEKLSAYNTIMKDIPATTDKYWHTVNAFPLKDNNGEDVIYVVAELMEKVK